MADDTKTGQARVFLDLISEYGPLTLTLQQTIMEGRELLTWGVGIG